MPGTPVFSIPGVYVTIGSAVVRISDPVYCVCLDRSSHCRPRSCIRSFVHWSTSTVLPFPFLCLPSDTRMGHATPHCLLIYQGPIRMKPLFLCEEQLEGMVDTGKRAFTQASLTERRMNREQGRQRVREDLAWYISRDEGEDVTCRSG